MKATGRNRLITIQRATTSQDDYGEPINTWATLLQVWAEAVPVSDGERIAAAEVSATISMRFRVLYSSTIADVNPKDRISYDSKTWDIWGVKEIGLREGFEITAAARVD
jgi:SPP1 family predicted phage head-tail adaptor